MIRKKLTDQLDPHEWWGAKLTTDHVFPIADYLYPKLSQLRMTKIPYSDQRNAYKLETTLNQQQWKHESRSLPRWSNTNRTKGARKSKIKKETTHKFFRFEQSITKK